MKLSARVKVDRVDIMCTQHNIALGAPHKVTLLKPSDYNNPPDTSLGWDFDLDELECPTDPDGDCVDSWEVFLIE